MSNDRRRKQQLDRMGIKAKAMRGEKEGEGTDETLGKKMHALMPPVRIPRRHKCASAAPRRADSSPFAYTNTNRTASGYG